MNVLTQAIARAKEDAIADARNSDNGRGSSPYIRTRAGNTIWYTAMRGPRGGCQVRRHWEPGWILDHPADVGEASY